MKRLFLRLWLVVSLGFVVSVPFLDTLLDRLYLPTSQHVFAEQNRGQLYALQQGLAGLQPVARRQQLAHWQPHYGIELGLLETPPALQAGERGQLQRDGMVIREDFTVLLAPLQPQWPEGPWLQLRFPAKPAMMGYLTALAYAVMVSLLGVCIYAWVRLLWRDLQALSVHADRIGAGELHARAQVSPRSQIRVIVDHSNRMASRVAELVQRQRDLTHAISHELRTPIARLSFGLDMMQDSDDGARRMRLADGMRGDLAELNRLISELLAYERLEHPGDGETLERIDADAWLQGCSGDAHRDADNAGLQLRVLPSTLAWVEAEPRLLQLVLSNLVGNALRHARARIEVSLLRVDGQACLRVDDDGAGIADGDRDKVLRPFTRLDDSRSRDTGGFGLGLAIAGRIAERHHGSLRVGRAPLGGARLEMRWPLAAS